MGKVLVLGSTGNVGGAVVEGLAAAGEQVRAGARDPKRVKAGPGVEAVRFDYADPATFGPALEGVDRVFLLAPAGVTQAHALLSPFVTEATRGAGRRIVLMTASGVEFNEAAPLRQVELQVERSGAPYVFLRPNWFMDNFHTYWHAPLSQAGVIPVPAADSRSAFIDTRDIAAAAVGALRSARFERRAFTLTGPESLTYAEAAAVLSQAAGRTLRYTPVEDGPFLASLVQAGLPQDYAGLLTALFGFVRQGAAARVTGDVQELAGRPPRTLAQYAQDHAQAFRAAA
jgi:uncharacterized protein YbjT (DUF2867 family)